MNSSILNSIILIVSGAPIWVIFQNLVTITMLAKTSQKGGHDWDQKLPYVLFAYQASEQQSSPFYLLYGRDPRLPTEAALTPAKERSHVELLEYGIYLTERLTKAWSLARTHIKKAQKLKKLVYDQHARAPNFSVGERVFLLKPAEKTGEG